MKSQRICIYPKDVMRITGKSERYARKLLTKIKTSLNKNQEQFITVKEFANYTGIEEATIKHFLND